MKKYGITSKMFRDAFIVFLVAELANCICTITDCIYVSNYLSSSELSAYGLCSTYYFVVSTFSMILIIGGQYLCAKYMGAGDEANYNKAFTLTMFLTVSVSLSLLVLGNIFIEPILYLFGAKGDSAYLVGTSTPYLRLLFVMTPFFFLYGVLIPIVQLDGDKILTKIAPIVIVVVNVLCDFLFIVVLKMHLEAVSIASICAYIASCVVLLFHFINKKRKTVKFSFKYLTFKDTFQLVKVGVPTAIRMIALTIGSIVINTVVLEVLKEDGMNAMAVRNNISILVTAPAMAISNAVFLLVGLYYNERVLEGMKDVLKIAIFYILTVMLSVSIILFILAPQISSIYVDTNTLSHEYSTITIRWYAIAIFIISINMTINNYLQAINRSTHSLINNALIDCVFVSIFALIFIRVNTGVHVGAAYLAANMLVLIISIVSSLVQKKKTKLFLPFDFSAKEEDIIDRDIQTIEEVEQLSKDTYDFVFNLTSDKKKSLLTSIAIEEVGANVVLHGFKKDNKSHKFNVRIVYENGDFRIRFRDDCKHFDMREKAKVLYPKDEAKGIGIKYVMRISKDVLYSNVMDTNNLIVII